MLRRPVYLLPAALIAAAALYFTSGRGEEAIVADLIAQFTQAKKQPADTAFEIADVTIDGVTKRSIIARGPTRLTSHVTVPKHAVLRTSLALDPGVWEKPGDGVLFFIGVADAHSFQTRASVTVDPFNRPADRRWRNVSVDLEEFAGLTISIVLNTRSGAAADASAQNDVAVWGAPTIFAR
jgi:hypothetical protein